ncbi:MAG TPA: methionyl-tRNA formyltransferase [Actinomycetota bacterium]
MPARGVRVAFLGNDRWSVPPLRALAASAHRVELVVTAAPKPAGRGNEPRRTPVAGAAERLALPLAEVASVRTVSGLERLRAASPDVLAVVAYGEILPPEVLQLPAIAPVNVHFSLLPRLRGASPVQAALLLGLEETGVTTMIMEPGLDTGPVVLQRREPIRPSDDAGSLGDRLARLGAELLVESIDRLAAGSVVPTPQDHVLATYAPRLGPRDRALDWTQDARALVNRCRALSPEPAATTTFRGEDLKLFAAEAVPASGEPGTIVEVAKAGFVVAAGGGGVRPLELAPAGRRRMSGRDFVNGFRPEVGERLG